MTPCQLINFSIKPINHTSVSNRNEFISENVGTLCVFEKIQQRWKITSDLFMPTKQLKSEFLWPSDDSDYLNEEE